MTDAARALRELLKSARTVQITMTYPENETELRVALDKHVRTITDALIKELTK